MAKKNFETVVKDAVYFKVRDKFKQAAESSYKEVSESIKAEILNHPISKELLSHQDQSKTFSSPKGSLFGFMGFRQGRSPVQELINFITSPDGLKLKVGRSGFLRRPSASFSAPSDEVLSKNGIEVDEWADGRSWPAMIESGIGGLSRFISKDKFGRSQEGFLIKNLMNRPDASSPTPYLTPIFKRGVERFKNLVLQKLRR